MPLTSTWQPLGHLEPVFSALIEHQNHLKSFSKQSSWLQLRASDLIDLGPGLKTMPNSISPTFTPFSLCVCSMPLPKHKVPLCWEYSFFLCPSTCSYLLRSCDSFYPLCEALLDHDSTTDGELINLGAGRHFVFYLSTSSIISTSTALQCLSACLCPCTAP